MRRCRAADMMVGPSCRKWSRRARRDKGKRSRRTSGIAQITPGREALNWPGCTTPHPRSAADPDGALGADVPDAAAPATLDAPGAAADWSGAAANQSAAMDTPVTTSGPTSSRQSDSPARIAQAREALEQAIIGKATSLVVHSYAGRVSSPAKLGGGLSQHRMPGRRPIRRHARRQRRPVQMPYMPPVKFRQSSMRQDCQYRPGAPCPRPGSGRGHGELTQPGGLRTVAAGRACRRSRRRRECCPRTGQFPGSPGRYPCSRRSSGRCPRRHCSSPTSRW